MAEFKLYIDGEFCDAADGAVFASIDPATEEAWAEVPEAKVEDVDRAVAAAKRALEVGAWADMSATARGRMLSRLGDLLIERADEFAEIETRDSGKVIHETAAQARYMAGYYHYYGGLADKIEGSVPPIDKPGMIAMTYREPLGVVAAVVPWNSQIFLTATKLGPALAAGNTVVLKCSEDAPATLLKFAELINDAGFPPGVVNVISGYGQPCGERLTSHPDVARVAFTGGPIAAQHVVRNTAENFAVLSLELGGKSPVMVFDDANVESAVNGIVAGIFAAAGQSCVAGSRLLIQRGIRDEVLEKLANKAVQIRIGNPMDPTTQVGPLCTARQRDGIEAAIAQTVGAGGEIITGGKRPDGFNRGFYFEPTIIATEGDGMETYEHELFGPVLSVRTFDDEDEAIALANASEYHYASGAFTRDMARSMRISKKIKAGITYLNTWRVVSPTVPFGGNKQTGYGRESGMDAINDYTRTKTVWINTSDDPMPDPFVMR